MIFKKRAVEHELNYWEEYSYMEVITSDWSSNYIKTAINNISKIKDLDVKDRNFDVESGTINLKIEYRNESFDIGIFSGTINVPDFYFGKFYFSEFDKEKILNSKQAITVFMKYNKNYDVCYHLQLKICASIAPDMVGLLDESAEKLLPAKWVLEAAEIETPPNPKSIFNVHAVQGNDGKVWLHTHGLARCGVPELEIVESSEVNSRNHYYLIATYAVYILDKYKKGESIEGGLFLGRLENGFPIVATSVSWTKGIKEYKKLDLGGLKDRENSHNTRSNIIFLYANEKDEEKNVLSKVSIYDEVWGDNPIFYFSNEETARMKSLAMERFSFVKEEFKNKDNTILIKIGLPIKNGDSDSYEHIWFELLEFKGNKFKAKLTQEPYDVSDIHTGDEKWFTVNDVTDWIIYTKRFPVTPDDVYLLSID